MRCFSLLFVALLVAMLAGCAVKPFPPPEIVGHVSSVSQRDIQIVIALAERSMRERIGWAVPTERIEVEDHDHFTVIYSYGGYMHRVPITRVRGRWMPPPNVVVTG
jgi:hypothetical protein